MKICGYSVCGFCGIHKERTEEDLKCNGMKPDCVDYWIHKNPGKIRIISFR